MLRKKRHAKDIRGGGSLFSHHHVPRTTVNRFAIDAHGITFVSLFMIDESEVDSVPVADMIYCKDIRKLIYIVADRLGGGSW